MTNVMLEICPCPCLHLGEVLPGPGVLGVQLLDVGVDLREPLGDGGGVPLPAPLRMAADVQHGPRIFFSVTNIFECHKYFGSGDKYQYPFKCINTNMFWTSHTLKHDIQRFLMLSVMVKYFCVCDKYFCTPPPLTVCTELQH